MTMHSTLAARRDRRGHRPLWTALLLTAVLLAPSAAAAAGPGNYKAQRFDVAAEVAGGNLVVAETIVFEFQSGTFKRVWRDIPTTRTDRIDIVEASMDGEPLTRGEGPGHFVVSGSNRLRVEWQFAETGPSVHRFGLKYVARGVVYRDGDRDIVRWQLLPNEHRYQIDESRSTITAPIAPSEAPTSESRRVGGISRTLSGREVTLVATALRQDGWVMAEMRYPPGSLISSPPEWQLRHSTAAALAPRWEMGAVALFVAALLILFVIRQAYESPGFDRVEQATSTEPPEALPVALAAALAAKGRGAGFPSVATLLDLADRGALTIHELPRRFGVRNYAIAQVPGKHDLAEHEAEALTIAFADGGDAVPLSKARARLARGGRRFSQAVNSDLAERGLLDPSRKAVRDRLIVVSIAMLFAGGLGAIGVAALIPRYDGWPFMLPLAVVIAGIIGVVMAAATTPLSDTGLMQSARWRGFKRYLKDVAESRESSGGAALRSRWVVYGIALGLGYQWSRYLKKHPAAAPAWFVAAANEDAGGAFAAFVGSHAASASTGAAGSGAAGGGGSGAG
jgi:Predicted membrane protein (DUF2207)